MILQLAVLFALSSLTLTSVYADPLLAVADEGKRSVEVGKQIQIAADLRNGQSVEQPFAYIVQIQDENGVTVSLSWLTGKLSPAQLMSPAVSWIPSHAGSYRATIFVWESITNPAALSPTLSLAITVDKSV